MDTPSARGGEGAPLSSTPSYNKPSSFPKTPYPLSVVDTPISSAKSRFKTPGTDGISNDDTSLDDASSSFAESDESLGIRSGFNLEKDGSFGRLSTCSGGQASEGANTSNGNSVPDSNNSPKQATLMTEVDILRGSVPDRAPGVPDRGTTSSSSETVLPPPSPSIRSYMLEYKNEPRPPSSISRTPLALSFAGLRRADPEGATSFGDYFSDTTPLMSPQLEAIDEVTEEMSARDVAFTPDVRSRQGISPSSLRRPSVVQEEGEEEDEDELAHQASLLSILSPLAQKSSAEEDVTKRNLDDSLFESPLAIPSSSAHLSFRNGLSPSPSPSSLSRSVSPASSAGGKRRPPPLDLSPAKVIAEQEAKIKDILWNVNDNEEESEILTPDKEDIGPVSPFFDSSAPAANIANHTKQNSVEVPLPVRRGRSGTIVHAVENLPPPVRRIPTLVGPNALPYARCPSGIDSFAFDHRDPRPYDPVLPLQNTSSITSNYHGEYEVPRSGRSSESVTPTLVEGLRPTSSYSTTAEYARSRSASSNGSSSTPFGNAIISANARARQRTEDKKQLIVKREQARFEQQGRREAARIARKLREDDARSRFGGATDGDTSVETQIGEEQLQWYFDDEKGGWVRQAVVPSTTVYQSHSLHNLNSSNSSSRLSSAAAPFVPANYARPGPNAPYGHSSPSFDNAGYGSYPVQQHMHAPYMPVPVQAENVIPPNRLVQILRERMPSTTSSYGSQSGYSLPSLASPTMPAFNMTYPGIMGAVQHNLAMSQAIQELSRSNQNLLAIMNMQRMANNAALSHQHGYGNQSGLGGNMSSGPAFIPAEEAAGFQSNPAPGLSITQPTPPKAEPHRSVDFGKNTFKVEDDPAIVHSYRRDSAASVFGPRVEQLSQFQSAASTTTLHDHRTRDGPALAVTHTLPTRPAPSTISPKLVGIIPGETQSTGNAARVIPEVQSKRDGQSSRKPRGREVQGKKEEKDRAVRENAPSPVEMKTPIKFSGRARDLPTPSPVKSEGRAKRTPVVSGSPQKQTRHSAPAREGRILQQLPNNAQHSKERPVSPTKGKTARVAPVRRDGKETGKEEVAGQPPAEGPRVRPNHKHKTVPKGYTGDEAWKAFVQQRMGGMARPASRGPRI